MTKLTFKRICEIQAAVNCLNAGQSFKQIAESAKVKPATVRQWVKQGGFIKVDNKWIHV